MEDQLDINGFSGSLVIDANGFVIGSLFAADYLEGEGHLVIEPINILQKWLKN